MQRRRTTAIVLGWLLAIGSSLAAQCTVCKDGSEVSLKEKGLGRDNQAIPIKTCGALELAVGGLGDTMASCQSARAVGSSCGCPIPENACRLCGDLFVGSPQGSMTTTVDAQKYIADSPAANMTCESVESFLHSLEHSDDGACAEVKGYASPVCCVDAVEVRVTGATEAPAPTEPPEPADVESSSVRDVTQAKYSAFLFAAASLVWCICYE